MPSGLTRRTFLKATGATAAGAYAARALPGWATSDRARVAVTTPLSTFQYGDVQLLDGPMKRQFDENHARFLNLDDDRLLKVFRQVAGLPAPGLDMGGWYDLSGFSLERHDFHGFIAGHSFGQYVSALARAYAVTRSADTAEKVHRLVKGYGETLDPKARFFAGYRLPGYTYDKLSCGLIDAHEFAHDPRALDIHEKLTRAVLAYLPEKALSRAEQRARPHKDESYTWDETYTLPENLFLAYQRSGKAFYRDLAKQFLEDDTYFGPLSKGQNVLPTEHAYSHVNAFSSAMQAYGTLGSEQHLRAAKNGFEMVSAQSFATGGWGPDEAFVEPDRGMLGDSLKKTHASFETPCGAYGHFKMTRYLLCATKDSRYGDSMERVLYNTILGAWPVQADGTSFYYSDYAATGKKSWHPDKWPCCSGTFPQLAADYHISTGDQLSVGWRGATADQRIAARRIHALRPHSRVGRAQSHGLGKRPEDLGCPVRRLRAHRSHLEGWRPARGRVPHASSPRGGRRPALEPSGAAARPACSVRDLRVATCFRQSRIASRRVGRQAGWRADRQTDRRKAGFNAAIHEHPGRKLQHVCAAEVLRRMPERSFGSWCAPFQSSSTSACSLMGRSRPLDGFAARA